MTHLPSSSTPPPLPPVPAAPLDYRGSVVCRAQSEPLTAENILLVKKATIARRYVRRAAWVAMLSAGTMLAIGTLSLLLAVFSPNIFDITVSVALIAFGYGEYRGAARMKRADPSAPWFLCRNQLLFIAFITILTPIVVYRFLPLIDDAFASNAQLDDILNQAPEMRGDIQDMQAKIHKAGVHYAPFVVAGIIALVAVSQGSLAFYYYRCKRRIRKYQEATPEWVQHMLAATTS